MAILHQHDEVEGHEPHRPEYESTKDDINAAEQLDLMLRHEIEIANECDNYFYGKHKMPYMPTEVSPEYLELARRSITNMVPLIISNLSQLLYVEGYIPSYATEKGDNGPTYEAWEANRMAIRQRALWRGLLRYGIAYSSTVDDDDGRGDGLPTIRLHPPSKMVAGYDDPANDERPQYAWERLDTEAKSEKYRLWRNDGSWVLMTKKRNDKGDNYFVPGEEGESGLDHCAIIRHTYDLDLSGRYLGEVRPVITLQDRLNQTVMDRMLVQTYGSFKIRFAAGLDVHSEAERLKISKSRMMIAKDNDTKFGTLQETSLDGFIKASSVDQETIAAVGVMPPHYLTGELNNLGPEAIAEARAAMEAKASEIKHACAEGVKQQHRDLAELMGLTRDAQDRSAQVVWHDAQNRSLSQVADALGKLATMLGVPVTELWSRIPGVTRADVSRWRKAYEAEQDSRLAAGAFDDEEERLNAKPNSNEPPSGGEPQGGD